MSNARETVFFGRIADIDARASPTPSQRRPSGTRHSFSAESSFDGCIKENGDPRPHLSSAEARARNARDGIFARVTEERGFGHGGVRGESRDIERIP